MKVSVLSELLFNFADETLSSIPTGEDFFALVKKSAQQVGLGLAGPAGIERAIVGKLKENGIDIKDGDVDESLVTGTLENMVKNIGSKSSVLYGIHFDKSDITRLLNLIKGDLV